MRERGGNKWQEEKVLVAQLCLPFCDPTDWRTPPCDRQALLSIEFSWQEYWSGLPFPSPGDLPDPGIEPRSLMFQADSLPSEPSGKLCWQDEGKKEKQGSGNTRCCVEYCCAGLFHLPPDPLSTLLCLALCPKDCISKLICLLPSNWYQQEFWGWEIVRSGCLFPCWVSDCLPASTSGHFVLVWGWVMGGVIFYGYFPGFKGLLLPLTLSCLHVLMVLYYCWPGCFIRICWFPWALPIPL